VATVTGADERKLISKIVSILSRDLREMHEAFHEDWLMRFWQMRLLQQFISL